MIHITRHALDRWIQRVDPSADDDKAIDEMSGVLSEVPREKLYAIIAWQACKIASLSGKSVSEALARVRNAVTASWPC